MIIFEVQTKHTEELIDITARISSELKTQNIVTGLVNIFIPHTTAGVTINENADPDVLSDLLKGLHVCVPDSGFKHCEGNSPAHIKSSLMGVSLSMPFCEGSFSLGTWQGIYLCEFDGPRTRKVQVTVYS